MNWRNYKSLKSSSIASVSKETLNGKDYFLMSKKSFNPDTGVKQTDKKSELDLGQLNNEKAHFESEIAALQAQLDDVKQLITDIGSL